MKHSCCPEAMIIVSASPAEMAQVSCLCDTGKMPMLPNGPNDDHGPIQTTQRRIKTLLPLPRERVEVRAIFR